MTSEIRLESRAYFKALGARIALFRKSRGLTQAELARAIGLSQQAVFAYETGERRVSVLMLSKIAKECSTSMEELLGLKPGMKPVRARKNSRLTPRAARHAERLLALPKTQQRFVSRIVDVLEAANAR